MIGQRLGPYEILAKLGEGGMGEVYRARDTTLGREVAIKVLPEAMSRDADRLARLDREAQMLASVNHPNIATIYGIEHQEGSASQHTRALVMELVEGPTIADLLQTSSGRRPLAIEEVVTIARQVVDALAAAHEQGIVHRDLKPANIKLRPDGTVKVLDFGLAKIHTTTPSVDAATIVDTITRGAVILGSPGYMSPEQARNQMVDSRTDIWAFGCLLFEMIAGRLPFTGDSALDLIAAALEHDPDWSALPADLPESLRRILRRCLQRDARKRLRNIADASWDLDEALQLQAPTPTVRTAAASPSVTFQRLTDRLGLNESPAISPDGRMVAFVAPVEGERHLWIRLLSGGAPLQITTDPGDHEYPRWTRDGSAIIYFAKATTPGESGTLMEISALGGPPRPLASTLSGGDSSHDGTRIATFQALDDDAYLVAVSRRDGTVERICAVPPATACQSPRWSPDDRWIAFSGTAVGRFDERLYVVPSGGGTAPQLIARAAGLRGAAWLPDGSGLVYSSSKGSTVPYPPTLNLHRISRDGRQDRAITFGDLSYVEPDVHASGRILASRVRSHSDIWRFPIAGPADENTRAGVRITRQSGQVQTPSVSPDGTEVVYLSDNGGHGNLWIAKTDGSGTARQLTFEDDLTTTIGTPLWSPVDNRVAFVKNREQLSLWIVRADGRGLRQLTPRGLAACWSPDGAWIYYATLGDAGELNIEKISSQGGTPVMVRGDGNSHAPCVGASALYHVARVDSRLGVDWEFRRAVPEDAPAEPLTRVSGSQMPVSSHFVSAALSRDGRSIALPLLVGATSTVGVLPVTGGTFVPVLDFGDRPTVIARSVSWSPDRSIYAAVAEIDQDIVLLDGLI